MRFLNLRRFFALLLALTLTVGLATHTVSTSDMSVGMTTAMADDMPMPNGCNGCGGDDGMSTAACFTLCSGVVAVLPQVDPVAVVISVAGTAVPAASTVGHHGPPDPYPPRPAILS